MSRIPGGPRFLVSAAAGRRLSALSIAELLRSTPSLVPVLCLASNSMAVACARRLGPNLSCPLPTSGDDQ